MHNVAHASHHLPAPLAGSSGEDAVLTTRFRQGSNDASAGSMSFPRKRRSRSREMHVYAYVVVFEWVVESTALLYVSVCTCARAPGTVRATVYL